MWGHEGSWGAPGTRGPGGPASPVATGGRQAPASLLVSPLQLREDMADLRRDPIVSEIIAAAIEVHRRLGPGLLESTYQVCLVYELVQRGLRVQQQVAIPVFYKGVRLDCGYRIDILVDDGIIVEIKSVATLLPIHTAQVLTYLRLTGARQALIFNFNVLTIKAGLKSYLGDGNNVTQASDQGSDVPGVRDR